MQAQTGYTLNNKGALDMLKFFTQYVSDMFKLNNADNELYSNRKSIKVFCGNCIKVPM